MMPDGYPGDRTRRIDDPIQPAPLRNPARSIVLILLALMALIGSAFWLTLAAMIWWVCWEFGAMMGIWGALAFAAALHLLWTAAGIE
jgi:hypothetical protein